MKRKNALYIDIDGTLARFHDADKAFIEAMWTPGFYVNLKPFESLVAAVKMFIARNPEVEVFSLSAVLDTDPPFVVGEKNEWLNAILPEIDKEHRIFTRAGEDKSKYIDTQACECSLLDDYNKNLYEFEAAGGKAIKFHNDINHRGLGEFGGSKGRLWDGFMIHYNDSPEKICSDLEVLVLGKEKEVDGVREDFVIEDDALVEYIGQSETVVIPEGIRAIGINAFWNNPYVKHVVFPESLKAIGNNAFAGVNLEELNLPHNLESISFQAFAGCNCLTSVYIPASVTYLNSQAFDWCNSLKEINISPQNEKYFSDNGLVYKSGWESNLFRCPGGRSGDVDVSRSNSFGRILSGAFKDCSHVTNIQLSDNLFSIGDSAFYGCSSLERLVVPSCTRHIHDFAFTDCTNLKSIVIPDHLESLGDYIFTGCKNLSEVVISDESLVNYCERFNFLDEVYMTPCYQGLKERYDSLTKGRVVSDLIQDATDRSCVSLGHEKEQELEK